MPKKLKSMNRRTFGPFFLFAVAAITFLMYSAAIAWSTVNDCDSYPDKDWQIFPPEWECKGTPGFG